MSHTIAVHLMTFQVWIVGVIALAQGIARSERPASTPYGASDAYYGLALIGLSAWVFFS